MWKMSRSCFGRRRNSVRTLALIMHNIQCQMTVKIKHGVSGDTEMKLRKGFIMLLAAFCALALCGCMDDLAEDYQDIRRLWRMPATMSQNGLRKMSRMP